MSTTLSVAAVASRTGPEQPQLPFPVRPPAAPAAVALLKEARHGLAEAEQAADPIAKFITSYLAALRAGAAVLAARGRPHRGRSRPASVWVLLEAAAPELSEWAAFFAAHSAARAAAQAGVTRRITAASADELCRHTAQFVAIADDVVHPRPVRQCSTSPTRGKARRG